MSHQKRISASKVWPIKRKGIKFITNSSPGPHKKTESISLNIAVRDILKLTKTTKETKKVLNSESILVDNIIRKDHKFPIGFLDIITLNGINKEYMAIYNEIGKLTIKECKKGCKSPYKVINKTKLKGNKLQLNLSKGKNILVDKENYNVGDSLILEKNKVSKHLKFEKGQKVFLIGGKHIGSQGSIENIKEDSKNKEVVLIKTDKESFETSKEYTFVIGENI
tara:strand:- start:150 stop:818 length:669 start_codon:yes stop_codon:yes gene_type:complete